VKRFRIIIVLLGILMIGIPQLCMAEEEIEKEEKDVFKVGEIQVTAPREEKNIVVTPSTTIINVEEYKMPGTPQSIVDILRDQAIIDLRDSSDLVQENDNIYMRGFDSRNFVTAMDGLSVEKVGGYKGGHFVDFSTIPFAQIESIEIIPGPHSALYSGRSIGGVLNVKTKTPKRYESLKPDVKVMTSYRSYNTETHRVNMDGGVDSFIYGFSYEKYHTDGYLRNNEADTETISGRFGYILPSDGSISLSASYQEAERESPVNNDPEGIYQDYYDSSYPDTESGGSPLDSQRREKRPYSFRLNAKQPTSIGEWTLGAYYSHDDQKYYFEQGERERYMTEWNSYGGNIQNEIELFDDHLVTVGFDYQQLRYIWQKIDESYAGFIQDKWTIIPRLTLTAGLRYEDITIWWSDPYGGPYIKTGYNQVLPKSFLTYELDDWSDVLRNTSVSVGVSRIWTPKSYCQV
jgi:outer membrane cobalamin receptor